MVLGLTDADLTALLWSTCAGLATAIGGLLAIIRRPEAGLLAFLLGTAIGVMATLSVLELFIENALENGVVEVSIASAFGFAAYVLLEPLLPHFSPSPQAAELAHGADEPQRSQTEANASEGEPKSPLAEGQGGQETPGTARVTRRTEALRLQAEAARGAAAAAAEVRLEGVRKENLLRLGFLMAVTMTLHNLPEGFAVAFSAQTELGPVMALAVAVHNVPEGLIVAAPIYAATGSRRHALLAAFLSGLSEPLGALLALLFVKPLLTAHRLQLMLAFVGGMMTAVCFLELLPEGRRCRRDRQLAQGTLLGGVVMAATLLYV